MIDIDIDQRIPMALKQLFSEQMTEALLDDLADGARAKWISLARRELTTAKDDYIRGIQPVQASTGERVISLVGWLANAVEKGLASYDMRTTLLGPGKGKTSKGGGRYRAIPFRHSAAGSAGVVGQPAGSQYGPRGPLSLGLGGVMDGGRSQAMGESIMQAARRLKATTQKPGQKTKWGARLAEGMAPKLAPHHSTDIFAGMTRIRHTYEKKTQTKFMTFRMISTKVRKGWMHPGIEPRHLAERVEDWVRKTLPVLVKNRVKQVLG